MNFTWDEKKRQANIRKHGIDFVDAPEIFAGPMLVAVDTREDYGEMRLVGIGTLRSRCVVTIFIEKDGDTIRVISIRKATEYEKRNFEKAIKN